MGKRRPEATGYRLELTEQERQDLLAVLDGPWVTYVGGDVERQQRLEWIRERVAGRARRREVRSGACVDCGGGCTPRARWCKSCAAQRASAAGTRALTGAGARQTPLVKRKIVLGYLDGLTPHDLAQETGVRESHCRRTVKRYLPGVPTRLTGANGRAADVVARAIKLWRRKHHEVVCAALARLEAEATRVRDSGPNRC